MSIHFHKWEILEDVTIDTVKLTIKTNRIYRRCIKCEKWQRKQYGYDQSWWSDSYRPDDAASFMSEKEEERLRKEYSMIINSRRDYE